MITQKSGNILMLSLIVSGILLIVVIWLVLRIRELSSDLLVANYYIDLLQYNCAVLSYDNQELSPEEELTIVKWQGALRDRAEEIGLYFQAFERPKDII